MIRTWFSIVAGACGCILLGAAVIAQGEPVFNVTSFIPERFVDLQWQLSGNANLNGIRQRATTDGRASIADRDRQGINLKSTSEYRFRTIPRFWSWRVNGGLSLAHTSTRQTNVRGVKDETSKTRYSPIISQTLEAGQYVASDFFISGVLETSWRYINDPNGSLNSRIAVLTNPIVADVSSIVEEAADVPEGDLKEYRVAASILPGWGRIYEGQYAATAMYIVDELKRNGLLKREPTFEEMRSLTETIYQYRLKHAIDARLHKIEALSKIMELLAQQGVIDDAGPHGYLFIQDVWDYFPRVDRRFGYQIKGGAGLEYSYRSDQLRVDDPDNINNYYRHQTQEERRPFTVLVADYCRPLGLRWQLDLTGVGRYYLDPSSTTTMASIEYPASSIVNDEHDLDYTADYDYSIAGTMAYIFNSRTRATVTSSYRVSHYHSIAHYTYTSHGITDENVMRDDQFLRLATVRATTEYRIAIPTTLLVSLRCSYDDNERERLTRYTNRSESHNGYYDLTVTLVHSLY